VSIRLNERVVDTVQGPKKAWIAEPTEHVVLGRDRLEAFLWDGRPDSELDRALLAAVRAVNDPHQLVVFRARSDDGAGSWSFDPTLTRVEADELGYRLAIGQLPTYRRMVAAGVFAVVHVEFGQQEIDALTAGSRRALDELEAGSIPEEMRAEEGVAVLRVDRWILHDLTMFFTESFDQVLQTVLPLQLPRLEERIPHLRQLVKSLPPSAID
jgi:hypothetical protein